MSHSRSRRAFRHVFEPEILEGRLLLSGGHTHARPAITGVLRSLGRPHAPEVQGLQGRISGTQASDGLYGGTFPGYLSYSGHGKAPVGDVLFGTSFQPLRGATATAPSSVTNGSAVFRVGYNGDQIQVVFDGESSSRIPGRTTWLLTGNVVGGTGRYDGATGPFSGTLTTFGGPAGVNGGFTLSYNLRFDQAV